MAQPAGVDREFYERELDEEQRLYDASNPVCRYYHVSRKAYLERLCRDLLGASRGPRVIADIGCGTGAYFAALAPIATRLLGVEYARSKARVARHRTRASNTTMVVGSATELPIETATCHLVLCSEVIEHFPNPDDVLREIVRISAPAGHIVVSTPVRYDPTTILRAMAGRRNTVSRRLRTPDEHGHYWYFAPQDVEARLRRLGANVIDFSVVPRIHFAGLPRLMRYRLATPELLAQLGHHLPRRGPLGDLGAFGVFVATKSPT